MKKILALSLSIAIVYVVSCEISIAFAWDSTFLAPEPLTEEISPADSAEPPALDISPSGVSIESTEPHSMPLKYFDVTQYGAVADGITESSSAFLAAWKDACSYRGHSTFLVPKGTFYTGPVSFSGPCHNNRSPKIEIMGTLKDPISLKDFPYSEWIVFENLKWFNLAGLKSKATFDVEGQETWSKAVCRRVMKYQDFPSTLKFVNISYGIVRDISLVNSKAVHVSIHQSKNFDLSGFNIQGPGTSPNTHGITISQSNNIAITSSTIGIGDDCVSIGPGSTRIHVSLVHCGPGHGISVGRLGKKSNEKNVIGVRVSNCTVEGTRMKSE